MNNKSKKDTSNISSYTKRSYLISHSIKQATNRVEKYAKKKKKNPPLPFSEEMTSVLRDKLNYYEQCNGKWIDRNSMIAAPYSAELFLSTERGMPNVMLGGPRYFFDELHLQDRYPDAVSRFPYNTLADEAAKVITRLLRRNRNLKVHAAIKIQSKYRGFSLRKKASSLFHQIILEEEKKKREEIVHHKKIINRWNSMVSAKKNAKRLIRNARYNLERIRMDSTRQDLIEKSVRILQRWVRMHLKFIRSSRGKLKRSNVHARRIQSFIRGSKQRKLYLAQQNSQVLIAWMWRKHWRRKYDKYAIKIQRLIRSHQLIRSVRIIQCNVRRFLAKLALGREQRKLVIVLRTRCGVEQQAISVALEKAAAKFTKFATTQHFKNIQSKLMMAMDIYCYKIIHDRNQKNMPLVIDSMDPTDINDQSNVKSQPKSKVQLPFYRLALSKELPHKLTIAILKIFSTHYHMKYLDDIGLAFCLSYLSYVKKDEKEALDGDKGNVLKKSLSLPIDSTASTTPIPTSPPLLFSYDEAQLTDSESLSLSVRPTRGLLTRVIVKGHLPDRALATAATLHMWTRFVTEVCSHAAISHRRIFPAKYACPNCLQPFLMVKELHSHISGACQGLETFSWINEKAYAPLIKSLVKCMENLDHVNIIRKYETLNALLLEENLEDTLAEILFDISKGVDDMESKI